MRRPAAELLTIGTELVTGSVINTNAAYLGRELTQLGLQVRWQSACRDEKGTIQEALRRALARSDVIFVSGGLGPTPDDITRESLAEFFKVPLALSQVQYRMICRYYRERGKTVPAIVKREACFPANAQPIFNRFGIALGFRIEEKGRLVIVFPGVPGELRRLFETRIKPLLKQRFRGLRPAHLLVVKTVGLSEPTVMRRLGRSFFKGGRFDFGIYPETGEATLRIYSDSQALIRLLKKRVMAALEKDIYSFSDKSLEEVVGEELKVKRWTLAVAESCTGGKISDRIIGIPGASRYFRGGVIAYQNGAKESILNVPSYLLKEKGAVSYETAVAMAKGVRQRFGSTLGMSITGIAGPTGGSVRKPVGLVYIALASSKRRRTWKENFRGDREQIQNRAAKKALEYLWRWLRDQRSARF